MPGRHCEKRLRLIARWRRPQQRRVDRGQSFTAWTVLGMGVLILALSISYQTTSWSWAESRTDLPSGTDGAIQAAGPDVVLEVGPERALTPPTATPSPAAARPAPADATAAARRARAASTASRRQAQASPRPVPRPSNGGRAAARPLGARCVVTFTRSASWDQGHVANIVLRNAGDRPVRGWMLSWRFGGDQRVSNLWNGQLRQQGRQVQVRDAGWNSEIAPGASVQLGFEAGAAPPSADPTTFALNAARCD